MPFINGLFRKSVEWRLELLDSLSRTSGSRQLELFVTNTYGAGTATGKCRVHRNDPDPGAPHARRRTVLFPGGRIPRCSIRRGARHLDRRCARSIRDIYAIIKTPPTESSVSLNVNLNGALVMFACHSLLGATTSNVVRGLLLPVLNDRQTC